VVTRLAEAHGVSEAEIRNRTRENTARLFAHARPWPPATADAG
jgi:hypothetical protein